MDLDPKYYPYRARLEIHRDHVRFAYAIIAAYAAIEQLKLIPEKDSFENRAWKPEKRQALEAKLRRAGVDLTELLLWHVRGGKTRLEIDRPPQNRQNVSVVFCQDSRPRSRDSRCNRRCAGSTEPRCRPRSQESGEESLGSRRDECSICRSAPYPSGNGVLAATDRQDNCWP
jgi:hypothetical protein